MKFAEVILPLSLEQSYTYRIPDSLERDVQRYVRVVVPFGKKRFYTALVKEIHEQAVDPSFELKEIHSVLDEAPVIFHQQMKFWEWMAYYYLCKLGEVYHAALPAGMKLESQTVVRYHSDFVAQTVLSPKEELILTNLAQKDSFTITEIDKRCGISNLLPTLAQLVKQGAVSVFEEVKERYTPKEEVYIGLSADYQKEEDLVAVFEKLKRARQQERLLLAFLELANPFEAETRREVSRKELLETAKLSPALLLALVNRGVFVSYKKEVSRLDKSQVAPQPLKELSDAQKQAYMSIQLAFETKEVALLYGVPASGKTELFLHAATDCMKNGLHVLYLLPEILITTHLSSRLAEIYGDSLLVYHSGLKDSERVELWDKLLHAKVPMIVLGVRSALFLPFRHLGLIVVDEEHEPSYQQQDPAPRYHARNAAIMLATMYGAKTLLGSATPSLDSYFRAKAGKYGFVELKKRFVDGFQPKISLVDLKELRRKKIMKESLFSPILKDKITETVAGGRQVLLLQNRRGFAPMMTCKACSEVVHCRHCDISLVYHKRMKRLICHYCGFSIPLLSQCPSCQSNEMVLIGFGVEKVEEELTVLFPEAKVERMDSDSTRLTHHLERMLRNVESGETDIVIGTQMLSKGLDFDRVHLVGVMNADLLMNIPDFRAHERAFQLLMQMSGRSGRRGEQGDVLIQTSQIDHPLLQMVQRADYEGMAYAQLVERKLFRYPPYYRLIVVVLRSMDEEVLDRISTVFAERLYEQLKDRVTDAIIPAVNRKQRYYIRHIILKIELSMSTSQVRSVLSEMNSSVQSLAGFNKVRIHYEVDN